MQPIETGSATVELAISGLTGFQDFQDRFLRLIGLFSYSVIFNSLITDNKIRKMF